MDYHRLSVYNLELKYDPDRLNTLWTKYQIMNFKFKTTLRFWYFINGTSLLRITFLYYFEFPYTDSKIQHLLGYDIWRIIISHIVINIFLYMLQFKIAFFVRSYGTLTNSWLSLIDRFACIIISLMASNTDFCITFLNISFSLFVKSWP